MCCYRFEGDPVSGRVNLTTDRTQLTQTAAKNEKKNSFKRKIRIQCLSEFLTQEIIFVKTRGREKMIQNSCSLTAELAKRMGEHMNK